MTTQIKNRKAIIIVAASIAVTLATIFLIGNASLKKRLQKEQIKSETLLSEKLLLDKEISAFRIELNNLKGRNAALDKIVAETSGKLVKKEAEIDRLISEKASVATLKKKVSELETMRVQLNDETALLNKKANQLQAERDDISVKLDALQKENEQLQSSNTILKAMVADNYRVDAVKGKKDRITSIARRTDKLVVSFDLPDNVSKEIYFKIITPDGNELNSANHSALSMVITENPPNYLASVDETMLAFNSKRIEMIYKPEAKLKKGIYRFNIYNEGNYLGSTQLRLK